MIETINGVKVTRFKYAPESIEKLTYNGGILPNLKKNPILFLLIPPYIISQCIHIYRIVKNHKIDVVHAHWIVPQGLCAAIVIKLARIKCKFIITSHGGDLYSLKKFIFPMLKKWIINSADMLAVVSKAMSKEAQRLGIPHKKISILPMGVDLKNLFIPPFEKNPRKGLIFVGRLVEKKGVVFLLDGFKRLLTKRPSEHLTIIGDGPLRENLELYTKSAGIHSQVTFLGSITNELLPQFLQNNEIAIFPSVETADGDQEGLGLTIVEAMGCECAVAASHLPAIEDIIQENVTGIFFHQKSPIDICEKVDALLANNEKRNEISKNGRKLVEVTFDWDICKKKYSDIFRQLITQP